MATKFQEEVMFWQGLNVGETGLVTDEVKQAAFTTEMDEIVDIIRQMLSEVAVEKAGADIAFKVWRNGLCIGVNDSYDVLGKHDQLARMLYGDEESRKVLQYRGSQEGFRLLKNYTPKSSYTRLKSWVIKFVTPELD